MRRFIIYRFAIASVQYPNNLVLAIKLIKFHKIVRFIGCQKSALGALLPYCGIAFDGVGKEKPTTFLRVVG